MPAVFVDISAIYALLDRSDANHAAAASAPPRLRDRDPVSIDLMRAAGITEAFAFGRHFEQEEFTPRLKAPLVEGRVSRFAVG